MSLPRVSSRTPLRAAHHRTTSSLALPIAVVAALHPKRPRHRASLFALIALVSLSALVFCTFYPTALTGSPAHLLPGHAPAPDGPPPEQAVLAPTSPARGHKPHTRPGPPLALTPAQELAAVSSFLASLPQNVLPPSVDPTRPIDPELVLDFDTRSPAAPAEVARVVDYVWAQNPVVLYCKRYSPLSRELKALLSALNLRPPPFVLDVDARDDAAVLVPLLTRLANATELPVLLVGGAPVGTIDDIRALAESGALRARISAAGGVVGGGGRRRKHRH